MPRRAGFLVVASLLVSSCSPGTERAHERGQVVARVDGRELTLLELQQTLAANRVRAEEPAARQLAIDSLIDRTVLASRARSDGLDREPAVMAQTHAAIDRVLALATIERIANTVPRPDDKDMNAFRDEHSVLFSKRRVYTVEELAFESDTIDTGALRAKVAAARRVNDITDWLTGRGIAHTRRAGTLLPEDAGIAVAETLQARAEGDLVLLTAGSSFRVLLLRRIESRPVAGEKVDSWIERHLLEGARRVAVDAAVTRMRAEAEIVLLGEFADYPPVAERGAATSPVPPSAGSTQNSIDRGVGALR
jgi:EpsD family peptidyl-prolyl cis-trans isomerase